MTDPQAVMSRQEAVAALTAPGQLFEMVEDEVQGVRMRVWKTCPPTLRSVLDLSLRHADSDFLVYEDRRTTFAEHYRVAGTLGRRLQERFGVRKGDRVAIAMRNLPEWVMAFWGAITAGAVVVPLNAWWTGPELAYGLEDSGASVVFADAERAERLGPLMAGLRGLRALVVAEGEGAPPEGTVAFDDVLGDVPTDATPPEVEVDTDDDATIFYTSGTTGQPKGAVGTHRNVCTNLMNLFFVSTCNNLRFPNRREEESAGTRNGRNAFLLSVPLFHATGCNAIMVPNTAAGGKLVMMHHFDPERALELIERERITTFGGVPAMVARVLDSPDFERRDTSSVRSISYGGAPAPPELVRRIRRHFPVGQPGNGYGMTEAAAVIAMNAGEDYVAKPDSVGPPVPVCDVAIVPEGYAGEEPPGGPFAPGAATPVGELWVRGPNVARGYWGRPEETATVFTRGWLHTGDLARMDADGFLFVVDRAKDVIIRGGENIYSVEVENRLSAHPAIAECALIGVPHEVLGEEVGAVVVLRAGERVTADELARYVGDHLAAYNVPKHFWFRQEPLPRNPAGKILKRELRSELTGAGTRPPDAS